MNNITESKTNKKSTVSVFPTLPIHLPSKTAKFSGGEYHR